MFHVSTLLPHDQGDTQYVSGMKLWSGDWICGGRGEGGGEDRKVMFHVSTLLPHDQARRHTMCKWDEIMVVQGVRGSTFMCRALGPEV